MSNDKSNETEKITIDVTRLRSDAGKKLDTTKNDTQSGIINLNEGANLGISHEFFTKEEKNTKTDKEK